MAKFAKATQRTNTMYVRHNDTHGTKIQDPLHETEAALVRYTDEWCDTRRYSGYAELVCIFDSQRRVFKIYEQRVIARSFGDVDN
jgi:hypothetical protein